MTDTALAAGALIYTHEQMDELPVGSVMSEAQRENHQWEKRADGLWHGINGTMGVHEPSAFSMDGYNKVLSRPGTPPVPPPQETLRQFMWKFRENAISGAHENGVSMEATMKGMRLLGLDGEWELGPEVVIKTLDDRLDIPEGAVIRNLNVAHTHPHYTLFVRKRRQWVTLLGRNGMGRDAVIVEYPGMDAPPSWWTEVGDEEAAKSVAHFKAQAWRVGQQIKGEQSWCGTYEHVIARVGVTARSLREAADGGFSVGDHIGQRDVARLPVGSLLFYRNSNWSDHWAVYRRDAEADNLTHTARIAGHRTENAPALGHYQATMTVLAIPVTAGEPATMDSAHLPQLLDLLPIGTVFRYSGVDYIICEDRQMTTYSSGPTPRSGIHRSYAFNGAPATITRFPGDNA